MISWGVFLLVSSSVLLRRGVDADVPWGFPPARDRRAAGSSWGAWAAPGDFTDGLVDLYGSNGNLTSEQIQGLLEDIDAQCYTASELLEIYSLTEDDLKNDPVSVIRSICPSLVYQSTAEDCLGENEPEEIIEDDDVLPTAAQVWGYGFLCVTIINAASLAGAFLVPCMNTRVYKLVMIYLIGLAVGTLTGSALLHLIPKTHGLKVKKLGNPLVWKNACILAGIYIFFFAERILKIVSSRKDGRRALTGKSDEHNMDNSLDNAGYKSTSAESNMNFTDIEVNGLEPISKGCHSHGELDIVRDGKVRVATVAYMIVFGDGLHNFVDGLAIGASFAGSLISGFSTSIAVACEEFPHELGDFAVLLHSGLSVKQALTFNVLSSLTCYAGLAVGILVGRLTAAEPYIFALAAGMFLYIALVDMLPEIANISAKQTSNLGSELRIFLLQNLGLLSGFGIMMLLAILHPYIKNLL